MTAPKTPAQRQAAHKARQQAAGLVRVSIWVRAEDAASLLIDAERYRMLRDGSYLHHITGELHPCDEGRWREITDKRVDDLRALHAPKRMSENG